MSENSLIDQYRQTFTAFSGADIVATFDGKVIGELQQISYSVTREKAPIYTMGSANPRSFARGKRGVAGSLVFAVFNRDAILETLKDDAIKSGMYTAAGNVYKLGGRIKSDTETESVANVKEVQKLILANSMTDWNTVTQEFLDGDGRDGFVQMDEVKHIDQLPPFTIGINFANEYGQRAHLQIYGVEFLNEGAGMSIDDVVTERAISFVARDVSSLQSGAKTTGTS